MNVMIFKQDIIIFHLGYLIFFFFWPTNYGLIIDLLGVKQRV